MLDILVPEEAELGNEYNRENPRGNNAYRGPSKEKDDAGVEKQLLLHHKLKSMEALKNFFTTVCEDRSYIESRGLPGPFFLGPFDIVVFARFTSNHVDHMVNPYQMRDLFEGGSLR